MLMVVAQAWAEEPYDLESITVEASRLDAYLPAQTKITREEIVDSHKDELTDLLTLTPGINVRQGGRGEARADMRGFDQRATLFTLNGVPVYEPYNGIINLDLFPVEMLESIAVVRGPTSSLFGPNGMAGTVKLKTLTPRAPLTAGLSTTWRHADFWDLHASAGFARDHVSGIAGGRFLTSAGFPLSGEFEDRPAGRNKLSEAAGTRLNSDRLERSGFADLGYTLPQGTVLHASFLTSLAEFGIPPSTTDFRPLFLRNDHQEFDHLQLSVEQPLTPHVGVSGAVFYSSYDTRESHFAGADFVTNFLATTARSDEAGAIAHVTIALAERDLLVIGGQIRRAAADLSDSVNGSLGHPHFTTTCTAFENTYFLTERVRLLAGLSYDVQTGGGRETVWELDPEGGVAVDSGRFGTSRAGVSRKIRFPTLRELFDPIQGNPRLQPEKALAYEIGHRFETGRLYVDASVFRSDVGDMIDNAPVGASQKAVNLDDAVLQGVEAAAGGLLTPTLRLDLNYTYLDAEARKTLSGGNSAFVEIQHKPPHRFNGMLRIFLPEEFVLRLEGLYTAAQVDSTNVEAEAFGLFNAQLSKRFGGHFEVFAGVDNVLDTDYEQKVGSPQPGRWEYAGFRARY